MNWLRLGAALMALGVATGAFGAHGLEARVTPERLAVWQTASDYHLLHALALVVLGARCPRAVGALLAGGIAIFCGSLYLLVLTDTGWLGAFTPIGGLSFILGWTLLAIRGLDSRAPEPQ